MKPLDRATAWSPPPNGSVSAPANSAAEGSLADQLAVVLDEAGPKRLDSQLVARLRTTVSERLSERLEVERAAGRTVSREDQQLLARDLATDALEDYARQCIATGRPVLDADEEDDYAQAVDDAMFGLGHVLGRLLEDDSIENINANGSDRCWITRSDGSKEPGPPLAGSDVELVELIRTVAARMGLSERRFDMGSPRLNLQLPDGSRLFAIMGVSRRPCLCIRRHRHPRLFVQDLVAMGTIDDGLREFLVASVRAKRNIVVCGGTGSGKTTMLRALGNEIPPRERLVTIEDTLELGFDRYPELHPDVVALEVREANIEGEGAITAADLVRDGLRMDPDRVFVGEARGDEVTPMFLAMTQGNEGSLCSVHADSSAAVFDRLSMYAAMAPERLGPETSNLLVANALDFVVFLAQERVEGQPVRRYVSSVREVLHAEGPMVVSNETFRPGPDGRAVPGVPMREETLERLEAAGYDRAWLERPEGWWKT